MQGKKNYKLSKVEIFFSNWFQLYKKFVIDMNKYFQKSEKFSQGLIVNDKYFRNFFHSNLHNNQGVLKAFKIFVNVY